MEDIDNWEKLTSEQVGVYLSDKRDSINVSQYADGTDSRYQYETGVQNQNPHQYLGKIKHKYQDIHRNPLSTFSRNAWNGLLQLPEGIGEEAINLGELVDVKLLRAFGGDEEFEKRLNAGATALRQKLKHWFDTYQFENPERIKENKFVADLGQGTGSLFAALGLTLATKSPNAAAGVFGINQAGNLTSEMRDRGVDIDKANQVGIIGGAIEGKLEQFGLHLWIENYATKKLGTFLAKQGLVEFTQEASQTAAEETLMRTLGERKDNKTIIDVAKDVIYSGIIGGIIGIGGGAVSIPATQAFKSRATNTLVENGMTEEQANSLVQERIYGTEEQRQELLNIVNESAKELQIKNAKKKLMEKGVKESKAQEMAYDLVVTPQEMGEDLVETLNKEADNDTLLNGSYEDDVKDFIEKEKVDIVAEAFDVKQELKDRFMTEGGVQEDEAEAAATLVENFTRTIYNETGETPREYIERKGLSVLDERYPADEDKVIDESELTEEERERVAIMEEGNRTSEDVDKLFELDDIPFYQESLDIARQNEKLDAKNPAYEGETININGQEKTVYNSNGDRIAQSEAALRNFYKWFGDSKVVDAKGRPLVVYHGTSAKFDTFDIKKAHDKQYKKGFFFTADKAAARMYGNIIMPVYLKAETDFYKSKKTGKPIDYIHPKNDSRNIWIVFDNKQIKSVDNIGTFSENTGNIYYQSGRVGHKVYSVFDLKVGDMTAIGDVQDIDSENKTIKINDKLHSMLMLDTQIQYKGLTVYDKQAQTEDDTVVDDAPAEPEVKRVSDNRAAVEEQKPHNTEYNEVAKEYFGVTDNLDLGGYILTDGDLLDLSGKKLGSDGRSRAIDHREISDAFEDSDVDMEAFINSGNIRYMPESNNILMSDVPTAKQYKVIEQILNRANGAIRIELMSDANNWGSYKDYSREYPAGTDLSAIKRDINAFYRGSGVRDITQYFQSAFAGSGVDYDAPSLEAIGSGEGNQAHGWGLYYALNKDVAERYRENFTRGARNLEYDGKEIKYMRLSEKKKALALKRVIHDFVYNSFDNISDMIPEKLQKMKDYYEREVRNSSVINDKERGRLAAENLEALKDFDISKLKEKKQGQVHEVDIPENPYLLDEQKPFSEQSDLVKHAIREVEKELGNDVLLFGEETDGKDIYGNLAYKLGSSKAASQMLEKHGVKGITYDGKQDGRCFVIFNPDDVRVIQKFYQGERIKRGSYNPKTRVINLFKKANRSTLIHELGHVFTMDYVKILEESGQTDKLAGFYEWLGINDISEATTETWEKMARGFETYIMEGQAPNISTQNLFERLRQWLVGVYKDLKGKVIPPEEINDDVREFFDKMLSQDEEMPDITSLKGRTQDILKVIQAAQKGESISVNGLSLEDVKKLVKASRARLPRKPQTLEQDIRAQGGIDIQLAKSLGIYDEKKGNRRGFFKKDGTIKREDSLVEFLQDAGYLEQTEADTYEQTAELQDKAIELVEKADRTYTPENQQKIDLREQLEAIASEAMTELSEKGIKEKELFTALKTLKSVNLQAVSKDELKYLKSQLKSLEKDYKKFMKNTLRNQKKDFTQKQKEIIDFIKAMPLSGEDKIKLLAKVNKAKFIDDFNKAAREIFNKGRDFYNNQQKKRYASLIKKEIRKSKPTEVTKQRYDYENNKLFADLRKWNNLTQDQAQEELAKIEVQDDKTETDLIRIRFLNYKANGMESSVELMEEVYNDIINAKEAGKLAKGDIDVAKAVNRELLKRDVLDAISQNDANKETFKTKFTNLYRRGLTNLYSMLNSIASKEIADRFEMETVINNADIRTYKHIENLTGEILNVLNLKSKAQLLDRLGDMGQIIDNITDTEGRVRELSKLHILDIYNAIKNEKTRNNYIRSYGEEQLSRVLRYLTPQDMMIADILMEDVNLLYPETNKVYIENYGMDLKKVDNYWPATSEHQKEADLMGDTFSQQTVPSFQKERVKGAVTPIPKNAWSKYLKHVKQSIYMINTANKYKELADTFKSSRVKNAIQTKFGDGVYDELRSQIERLSLNGISEDLNYIEGAFGAMLNNFVVAKIAVAPTVFVGQLTSITNYSENTNTLDFYKNFAEGLSHPKKTIEYMKKISGDFLEARYKGGYSEAVSRVLSEAGNANKQKYRVLSTGTKYNVVNALTSWVRMGDIGAIIFGGYAQIKSNIDNGMSLEDAKKKFEFDTLRSQQSSNAASLSSFQQSKGFARMFLAFKNTQHQYLRKLADAIISYQRGEIGLEQCGKIILNYAIVQTSLYVIAKNLTKAALGLSDDDDELTDGVIEQILIGSIDAIPVLSDLLRYTYKRLTKQYAGGLVNMPGVDDIEKAINKIAKKKKDVYDYVDIISPLIEGITSLPVQRFKGIIKKYTD